jgi:hypothetical protein
MNSVVSNFRNEFKIGAPPGVTTGTWSVLLMSVPNPEFPLLAFRWTGDDPPAGGIEKVYCKNTSFAFQPTGEAPLKATTWTATANKYRFLKKSVTHYMDASDLYNQGMCYASQTAIDTSVNPTVQSTTLPFLKRWLDFGLIPTQPGQIMQSSSKAFRGPAKEGCFQVSRFVDPTALYNNAYPEIEQINYSYIPFGGGTISSAVSLSGGTDDAIPPTYTSMSLGYTLFTGLLPQASINSKCIHSIESVPDINSTWAVFATPGPCPDGPAMDLGSVEMYKLADGMPSAANDLAAFWNAAKSLGPVLKSVYKGAKPLLQEGLKALPAGNLLNQIMDGIEDLVVTKTKKPKTKKGRRVQEEDVPQPMAKRTPKPKKKKRQQQEETFSLR